MKLPSMMYVSRKLRVGTWKQYCSDWSGPTTDNAVMVPQRRSLAFLL